MVDEGYPQRPFALAGDSAGGSLSLVTLMRARDAMLPLPDCAALLSPSTDLTMSGPSARYNAELDPMFAPAAVTCCPTSIARPGPSQPAALAAFGNWNGLPPLLFHAGSTEMLLDDSVRAHDRATQAGVQAGDRGIRGAAARVPRHHVDPRVTGATAPWQNSSWSVRSAIANESGHRFDRAVGIGQ